MRLLLDPSSAESPWVSLLSWNNASGSSLVSHVAALDFALHPSSGEIELGSLSVIGFQHTDEETWKASVALHDWKIVVIYSWIVNDPDGEDDGWKVLDVHTECTDDNVTWYPSVRSAQEAFNEQQQNRRTMTSLAMSTNPTMKNTGEADNDDDYWNMYDRSSNATPAVREVSNPPSEDTYFDQYSEVEPVIGAGDRAASHTRLEGHDANANNSESLVSTSSSTPPTILSSCAHIPRPLSSGSECFTSIAKMAQNAACHDIETEVAVKQHISTSMKSLYRLSKAAGIDRSEFESIIHIELSVLSMLDADED